MTYRVGKTSDWLETMIVVIKKAKFKDLLWFFCKFLISIDLERTIANLLAILK